MDDKQTAKRAGLLYLVIIVTGIFDLMVIPGKLIVAGDAEATFRNIKASEGLFRLGIAVGVFSNVLWLLLPLALYRVLKSVNMTQAFFFFPAYAKMGISSFVIMPAGIGEIAICLWLLILGVKKAPALPLA
jgi:hypothetical protein